MPVGTGVRAMPVGSAVRAMPVGTGVRALPVGQGKNKASSKERGALGTHRVFSVK